MAEAREAPVRLQAAETGQQSGMSVVSQTAADVVQMWTAVLLQAACTMRVGVNACNST